MFQTKSQLKAIFQTIVWSAYYMWDDKIRAARLCYISTDIWYWITLDKIRNNFLQNTNVIVKWQQLFHQNLFSKKNIFWEFSFSLEKINNFCRSLKYFSSPLLKSSITINSSIVAWTNSFIRIYPKLTTIQHNKIFLVGNPLKSWRAAGDHLHTMLVDRVNYVINYL